MIKILKNINMILQNKNYNLMELYKQYNHQIN